MWTKQAVDEALKSYISDKARALHLSMEIAELRRRCYIAVKNLAGDEAGPKAQQITDMPHGTGTTNPTEQIAIKVASGWLPPEIRDMKRELQDKQKEYDELNRRLKFVDAWMGVLNEREHWIMLHQYMMEETWHNVMTDYQKLYGDYVSKDTLKRMRGSAFKKMYRVAEIRS